MAALIFNTVSSIHQLINHFCTPCLKSKHLLSQPPECHVTVTKDYISDLPIVIVGDIHGCYDELQELITKAKEMSRSEEIFLVCVGDMLNKGPKSQEVVRLLQDLANKRQAVAVRGNHEESILREYRNMSSDQNYELPKKYAYLRNFSKEDFEYVQALPYTLFIPHINAIIVHAGLVPGVPLKCQSYFDLCHMRNLLLKQKLWGRSAISYSKVDEGVGWATQWEGPEHVYFGHDARRGLQELPFATGLDTGCVYGGVLTAAVITNNNTRQFISVPAQRQYKG